MVISIRYQLSECYLSRAYGGAFGFAMEFVVLCLSILARYREGISLTLSVTKPAIDCWQLLWELFLKNLRKVIRNRTLYLFLRIVDDSISSLMRLVNQCDSRLVQTHTHVHAPRNDSQVKYFKECVQNELHNVELFTNGWRSPLSKAVKDHKFETP